MTLDDYHSNNKIKERTPIGRTFSSMFLNCFLMVMLGGLLVAAPATAQTETFVTVVDDQGPDQLDQATDPGNSQQDLTGARIGDQGSFGWAWDEIDLSGNNSIDTCTYFEETDGTVTSVCYSVQFDAGDPPTVTDGFPMFEVYDCGTTYDGAQQKCTGNNPVSTDYALTCGDPVQVPSYFTPDDQPDLQADCSLMLANGDPADDLLLLNTCTKTSASPSSNSNDCLFSDAVGFLQLEKVVVDGNAMPSDFTLTAGTLTGTAPVALSPVTAGVPQALSESSSLIDDGTYQLDSIVCTDNDTMAVLDTSSGSVTVVIGQRVTCTFTNSIAFVPDPAIDIIKTAVDQDLPNGQFWNDTNGDGFPDPGETIDYTFDVQNVGNIDLVNVSVTDLLVGPVSCPKDTLSTDPDGEAPFAGESMTCSASYTLTQSDIDAGQVFNTATANGEDANGTTVEATDNETVILPAMPGIEIIKEGTFEDENGDGNADVDETISYTLDVTNTGNVSLTNVDVTDPLITVDCGTFDGTLDVGESVQCTGSYTVTQSDIDAGEVLNLATTTGDCPDGTVDCASDDDPHDEDLPQAPGIEIIKEGTFEDENGDGNADVDETISYTLDVTNTGNVSLTNVDVTDPLITVDCGTFDGTLDVGESVQCTGSYTVTQSDIDAGEVLNLATTTGDCPDGTVDCASDDDPHDEDLPQAPGIEIIKEGTFEDENGDGNADVDETISYTLDVTNTGNVSLTNVDVTDPLITVDCGTFDGTLDVGESVQCTGSYTVTQSDIDAGEVLNLATTTGDCPDGTVDCASDDDPHDEDLPQAPGIEIIKEGTFEDENGDGNADVDETISYTLDVTNTGNVSLTNVDVTDPLITVDCGTFDGTLDVGESVQCTGSYTVTQSDIDAGEVLNLATTTGDCPDGTVDCASDDDPHDEDLPQAPGIEIIKEGTFEDENGDGNADVDETISYTLDVTNTGNVSLTNVDVTDPLITVDCGTFDGTLDVGESVQCTGSYTVTQSDIDAGEVLNLATTTGDCPDGTVDCASDDDPHDEDLPQAPGIEIIKEGTFEDENGDGNADVDETISYTLDVTNTGNVSLTNVDVTDPLITVDCGTFDGTLDVGESVQCTGSYTVTQSDIDAGEVLNLATTTGDCPDGTVDCASDDDPHDEDLPQAPGIEIIKEGTFEDENGDGNADVDETISYTLDVTNTGNVSLTNVDVTDPLITVDCGTFDGTLDVGESVQCTGSYTVTQSDIDAGEVLNLATTTGDCPDGTVDCASDDDPHDEDLPQAPGIEIIKEGTFEDENGDGNADVDETISYTLDVTNTGNVSLTNVDVTDPLITVDCGTFDGTLDVGESVQCTGSYTVTQSDIDAGEVLNLATTTGDCPDGTVDCASDDDPHDEDLPQAPGIEIIKEGTFEDENGDGNADVDETISYTLDVTNTGNVSLTNVDVTDPLITVDCGTFDGTLDVGESVQCTGSYTVTQSDIDAGEVLNLATTTGDCPDGTVDCASDDDPHDEDLPQAPGIEIIKDGTFEDENGDGFGDVGETISYTLDVENTGNVTLTNVDVSDPLITVDCGTFDGTLDVGESIQCTGSYIVTQADIDAGSRDNLATATGDCPDDDDPSTSEEDCAEDEDDDDEPLPQNPAIEIIKDGTFEDENGDGFGDVGETISYTLDVENTGNVTLTNVDVSDPLITVDCGTFDGTLDVGESIQCTGSYVVTQADIDAGSRDNLATATGDCPDDDDPSTSEEDCAEDEDDDDEPLPQNPAIEIIKDGTFEDENGDGFGDVGETISYTLDVENTGNVTLTNVDVSDPLITVDCGTFDGTLDVGESIQCTGSYVVTQADIDAGSRDNLATATGDCPDDDDPSTSEEDCAEDEDDDDEPLPQDPEIELVKMGSFEDENGDGFAQVGETISYTLEVNNIGNVTLSNVDVTDPLLGMVTCPSGNPIPTLMVGETETCTGSYAVTQADIDAGNRDNLATTTGDCPDDGDPSTSEEDCVEDDDMYDEPLPRNPDHTLVKDFDPDEVQIDGDGAFTLVYTNTGNVTLTDIMITDNVRPILEVTNVEIDVADGACGDTDNNAQTIECSVDDVAPGETVTVTVDFTAVPEADVLVDGSGNTMGATYVFYFVNGWTLYGNTETDEAFLRDPDGNVTDASAFVVDDPGGNDIIFTFMDAVDYELHLSCSELFLDGWPDGEQPLTVGDGWQIDAYDINRFNSNGFLKSCGQAFTPFDLINTAQAKATAPEGTTLEQNPIEATDTVTVIDEATIQVSRTRNIKGGVKVQLHNFGVEDVVITDISLDCEPACNWSGITLPFTLGAGSKVWVDVNGATSFTIEVMLSSGSTFTYVHE